MEAPAPSAPGVEASPAISRERAAAGRALLLLEHLLLILAAVLKIIAAGSEVWTVVERQVITFADILLMFLYTDVIGMIAVFYTGRGLLFVYPIFIAITALARLIGLQGKDMAPENALFEAAAILLLSFAALVMTAFTRARGRPA